MPTGAPTPAAVTRVVLNRDREQPAPSTVVSRYPCATLGESGQALSPAGGTGPSRHSLEVELLHTAQSTDEEARSPEQGGMGGPVLRILWHGATEERLIWSESGQRGEGKRARRNESSFPSRTKKARRPGLSEEQVIIARGNPQNITALKTWTPLLPFVAP